MKAITKVSARTALPAALLLLGAQAFGGAVVLYQDRVTEVQDTLADPTDLWIHPEELPRVNGFELKPEGACIDDICVPVRQDRDSEIFVTRQGQRWFNVVELADRLKQPYAVDHEAGVWSFGVIPVQRASFLSEGVAPDFTLPDPDGRTYSLSDFKGRKIMLLSWASW
jgi:hypothetical protein